MRFILTILCILFYVAATAQKPDYGSLKHVISDFDKALETRDTVALKWMLSDEVGYGHSNGWVETKKEVIEDLFNGKLSYKRIKATKPTITIKGNVVATRSTADIDAEFNGKLMSFSLKVLQIWIWENEHWVMLARQSAPVQKEK